MGINISEKYGFNPSVQKCSCCGNDMGLVLFGASYKDESGKTAEAPHSVMTGAICDECSGVIKNGGTFFIEVRNGEGAKSPKNPYRTGRLVAIKTEVAQKMFNGCKSINYMEQDMFTHYFQNALDNKEDK